MSTPDPWTALRSHTSARIALGRAGDSLPTVEWLRLGVAHALARDAVHQPLDVERLVGDLQAQGFADPVVVDSAAADRATYLRRPDLGRRLSARSAGLLPALAPAAGGLLVLIGDGLSARAAQAHAVPLLVELRPLLEAAAQPAGALLRVGQDHAPLRVGQDHAPLRVGQDHAPLRVGQDHAPLRVAVATQARVALGDEAGALLDAGAVLVLIGERPGLSSPDSLGAYLTWAPRPGLADSQRNCVSNIRPEGLPVAAAARRIAWLLAAARQLGATGVALKDGSDGPPPALAGAAGAVVSLAPAPPAAA